MKVREGATEGRVGGTRITPFLSIVGGRKNQQSSPSSAKGKTNGRRRRAVVNMTSGKRAGGWQGRLWGLHYKKVRDLQVTRGRRGIVNKTVQKRQGTQE